MLKTLLKKQLWELRALYFRRMRNDKPSSPVKKALIGVLFGFLFLYLAGIFAGVAYLLSPLLLTDYAWLYGCLIGLMALGMGVLGSVFNTYAGLYHARDNEALLAMPIPPSSILLARLATIGILGFGFEALVFVPAMIVRWIVAPVDVIDVMCWLWMYVLLGFLILAVTCLLGWLVALIVSRFKGKNWLTVVLSVVFLVAYFYVFSQAYRGIDYLLTDSESVSVTLRVWAYPLYQLGRAAEGNGLALLALTAEVAALCALIWWWLTRTFYRIVTRRDTAVKPVRHTNAMRSRSVDRALFRREWQRYSHLPGYMLNCSLGSLMVLLFAAVLWVKRESVSTLLLLLEGRESFLAVAVTVVVCLIASTNYLTAPSVSLEGKNLWILQSMPLSASHVFLAKKKLHFVLTVPPVVLSTVVVGVVVLDESPLLVTEMALAAAMFVVLSATAGLVLNLKFPNLTWTNETVVVKQGISVGLALFGGWAVCLLCGLIGYWATPCIGAEAYLLIIAVVMALTARLLDRWLDTRGVQVFASL